MNLETLIIIKIILVLTLLGISPIITVWSLNTLFNLDIILNFKTYFAALWLFTGILFAKTSSN